MKINIIILTLFFFFFSKLNAGQIFIVVKNIEEKVGSIHFALYDDADFFPDNEGKKIGFKKDVKEVIEGENTFPKRQYQTCCFYL